MALRRTTQIVGLALAAQLLAPPSFAATEITFWHSGSGPHEEAINALIDRFNGSQNQITVSGEYVGDYDEMMTKLQAAIPAGNQPDVVQLEATRFGLFAARDQLQPLEPYFEQAGPEFTDQIRPFAREAALYQGQSYVIPFNVSTPVMYYNKDHFEAAGLDPEAPPATWDELLEAAKALTVRQGDEVTQWGVNAPPQWVRWAFTHQNEGGWVDAETNEVQMGMPESAEAYQFAADLVNVHQVASTDAALDEDTGKQYFLNGNASILFGSTGSLGRYREDAGFDLGVAKLPCHKVCAAPIGGATLGIMSASPEDEKAAAWQFLEFINQPEQNATVFATTGYLPVLKGTTELPQAAELLKNVPAYSVAIDQLDVAFGRARPPAMPAIRRLEPAVWESIVLEQETAEEALGEFAKEMEGMIAEG
ncbi:MAG: ABC transporter substrate-binding protein [Geminicoccaceae bacterium]